MSNVVIIGAPGSGKTSAGQALAQHLQCSFFDTDALIEKEAGMSVPEIFASKGEPAFRALERNLLERLVKGEIVAGRYVMATGGGIAVAPGNFELLAEIGMVVCLHAPAECLANRLADDKSRPLLAAGEGALDDKKRKLSELLEKRREVYGRAPYSVDTSALTPAQVALAIATLLDIRSANNGGI